ncbi:MAG TPA: hypothetical protein DCS97_05930, partial [Planctomycetes bacterium]|nr:hypothetical protein [Planctomycetota bacterium]
VSLAELARDQGLSPRHLARRFVAAWGMTPDTYHQRLRADYAIGLLERADLPLAEVAQRLGYATAFAFSKAFKRWSGLSPHGYRCRRRSPRRR